MVDDRAVGVTVSLYKSQIDKIRKYVKSSKRFRTEAALMQYMVNNFFAKKEKSVLQIAISYIGYPIVIMSLILYVAITTRQLNNILIEQGYYFNELYVQSEIYYIIGFAALGLTLSSFYLFYHKIKGA